MRGSGWSTIFLAGILLAGIAISPGTNVYYGLHDAPRAPQPESAPAAASGSEWPKDVDQFLAGQYLQKADVILEQRSGDLPAWVIRWATNSQFSHAALVYTAPPYDSGLSTTFVIEAGTKGVDLTKLSDYLRDTRVSFIAIKRLKPQPWFDAEREARVRGLLVDKIKAHYDYWTIFQIAKQFVFGVQEKVGSRQKAVESFRDKDWSPPNEFICSGLVQIGFVEMILEAIKNNQVSPEALRDVVFTRSAEQSLPIRGSWASLGDVQKQTAQNFRNLLNDELYSVTPEDLAQTEKLDWMYLIKANKVYKISSYDDVLRLTK